MAAGGTHSYSMQFSNTWDYDEEADVLYLSVGNPRPALGMDIGEGLILRYDAANNEVVPDLDGATPTSARWVVGRKMCRTGGGRGNGDLMRGDSGGRKVLEGAVLHAEISPVPH